MLFSIEAQDIKIQNLRSSREKCSHLVPLSGDKTDKKHHLSMDQDHKISIDYTRVIEINLHVHME